MGNQVRFIRRMQDITQVELAKAAGITQPFLVDIEKGRRGARPETWQRIAAALGVTVEQLRGDEHGAIRNDPAGG